jgi:hypothetical protein
MRFVYLYKFELGTSKQYNSVFYFLTERLETEVGKLELLLNFQQTFCQCDPVVVIYSYFECSFFPPNGICSQDVCTQERDISPDVHAS